MPVHTETSGQVQMTSSETLNVPLLAERIAHERELRIITADYERQLRIKSDEHEKETRELVSGLRDEARKNERDRIEERLQVLNNERARQETDRSTFATRNEVALGHAALEDKTSTAIRKVELAIESLGKNLSAEVRTLREQAREDAGRDSGRDKTAAWFAPSAPVLISLLLAGLGIYLALTNQ